MYFYARSIHSMYEIVSLIVDLLFYRKMPPAFKEWNTFLLLLVAITAKASTHCEQKWDDIIAPHSTAKKYYIKMLKINNLEESRSFIPNTTYRSKFYYK
jgi:hypothetical protein